MVLLSQISIGDWSHTVCDCWLSQKIILCEWMGKILGIWFL